MGVQMLEADCTKSLQYDFEKFLQPDIVQYTKPLFKHYVKLKNSYITGHIYKESLEISYIFLPGENFRLHVSLYIHQVI